MHTSSNSSGCGGSKLYVQYWTNVQHRGACLSGVGGQPLLSTLNECSGALYRDNLSMGTEAGHILLFESAWRHYTYIAGCCT